MELTILAKEIQILKCEMQTSKQKEGQTDVKFDLVIQIVIEEIYVT